MSPTPDDLRRSQPQAWQTLFAAVRSGRMHHAYVLSGQQVEHGLALAHATSAALVCSTASGPERPEGSACGQCAGCRKHSGGNHPDVITLTPDEKGVIRIDAIRDLAQRLSLRAAESETKIVRIAHADQMNVPAQNALLKTLEEPPGPSCFFLVVRRYRALLPTVRSRSQRVRLMPVPHEEARQALVAGGVQASLAPRLAALCGSDIVQAEGLIEEGCEEVHLALQRALAPDASACVILDVASDLGTSRARADLALDFLELELRDRLARRHGASPPHRYDPETPQALPHAEANAVERIWELRRHQAFHLNRTLALEGVLLELAADRRQEA